MNNNQKTRKFCAVTLLIIAGFVLQATAQVIIPAATFVVNSTADTPDATLNGTCADASGNCTFRAAIQEANNTTALDAISFNIAGAGTQVITVTSVLPTVTNPVIIDGYTQPGASANTLAVGNNAVLRIELRATSFVGSQPFTIVGGNSTMRGLIVNLFQSFGGVQLSTNGINRIEGCWFGLNADGTASASRDQVSIVINSGNGNIIGGLTPQSRNVMAVVGNNGSLVISGNTSNHIVQNNYIGTDPSGTQKRTKH